MPRKVVDIPQYDYINDHFDEIITRRLVEHFNITDEIEELDMYHAVTNVFEKFCIIITKHYKFKDMEYWENHDWRTEDICMNYWEVEEWIVKMIIDYKTGNEFIKLVKNTLPKNQYAKYIDFDKIDRVVDVQRSNDWCYQPEITIF